MGGEAVTPELALVDPALAEAQRQETERKAAMSSTEPSNGTFFVDPAQPVPANAEPPAVPPSPPPVAPTPAPASAFDASVMPMRDVPLGTLIFRAGLLAEEQLEDALQEGMRAGKRLGEVLLERGWLHERDLGRLLAGQKGLEFVELNGTVPEPEALYLLPEEKARLQSALPLRFEDGRLMVAVTDPSNELMLENLRRTLGYEPQLVVASFGDLTRAIDEAYRDLPPAPVQQPAEPALQPEPLQPEPAPVPDPTPEAAMTTIQPDPLQPEPTLAPEPLPTVLPPAEERADETVAPAPLLTPPLEPAPEPLVEQPPLQPPAPAAEVPAAPPAEAVVVEPAIAQPAPVQPTVPPLHQAETPAAPAVEPQAQPPVPQAVEVPQAPVAPPPVAQPPVEPVQQVPVPPVVPEAPPQATSVHFVVLRLREGEQLEIGSFPTADAARAQAQEVVSRIAAAEGQASWPSCGERFLRPDTIVSVDVVEEPVDKWSGSAVRTHWATQS